MMTRREWLKAGMMGTAGLAAGRGASQMTASGKTAVPISTSPVTRAFASALPIPAVKTPVAGEAALHGGPVNHTAHQRYDEFRPVKFYELEARENIARFHPDLGDTMVWGYDGTVPGPTFQSHYGQPILVRIHNGLPKNTTGFGLPEISTHLHNAHTASESDGFPADYHGSGAFRDHHYCFFQAGHQSAEAMGSLWYHDHRFDFTAPNVYRGLTGFHQVFDELDSGNEHDTGSGLRLPSGDYDVPLIFQDRIFDAKSQLVFDMFNTDGILGDKYCVNGQVQPYFKVARRKYRFRLLDGGPSRFYQFFLSSGRPFTVISSDGNLLASPVSMDSVRLGVAERVDLVIDFSDYNLNESVYLVNRLEQVSGRGPTGKLLNPGIPVMRFDVVRDELDPSQVPVLLRPQPDVNLNEVVQQRSWTFSRHNGMWTINDKIFDINEVRAQVKQNTAEIWTLKNDNDGWSHPIHIHFEEHRILSRNGLPPRPYEGRKDVTVIGPNEEVKIFFRFRDFLGRYPMHCHNLIHEDHAMMLRWDIVP